MVVKKGIKGAVDNVVETIKSAVFGSISPVATAIFIVVVTICWTVVQAVIKSVEIKQSIYIFFILRP